MFLKSVHGVYGVSQWEDYADNYDKSLKNKQNMICVYEGAIQCIALLSQRGRVLATKGIDVAQMQYLITAGYIH